MLTVFKVFSANICTFSDLCKLVLFHTFQMHSHRAKGTADRSWFTELWICIVANKAIMRWTSELNWFLFYVFGYLSCFVSKLTIIFLVVQTVQVVEFRTISHVAFKQHISIKLSCELFVFLFITVNHQVKHTSTKTYRTFKVVILCLAWLTHFLSINILSPFFKIQASFFNLYGIDLFGIAFVEGLPAF